MHANNNTPDYSTKKYYLGLIDEHDKIFFYVWLGDSWLFANPDPRTWNGRLYTFCRMTDEVIQETIKEVRATESPFNEDSPFYHDYSKYRLFAIPVEDAPIWGLPAGVSQ